MCYSLSEKTVPTNREIPQDGNVEMSWFTFGGEYADLYEALVKAWCENVGFPVDDETVSRYFRLHLERGIAHLNGSGVVRNLDDLIRKADRKR